MDYKDEMRKLIDIVKQQSFEAKLEDTLEDLLTLTTATKDLSDRISTRVKKSLNPNDKEKAKVGNKKGKAKTVNPFPSVKPLPIPKPQTAQQKADRLQSLANTDFNKKRDDFVQRQLDVQPIQPIKPS